MIITEMVSMTTNSQEKTFLFSVSKNYCIV